MDEETSTLLKDILDWMLDNDYECGKVGNHIWGRIIKLLGENNIKPFGD